MTFPWKKAKSTILSRLVADLHRPPKSGGAFVLETGFPTSLVDLIVKNSDRLRKSPKRMSTSEIQNPFNRSFPVPPCEEKARSSPVDDCVQDVESESNCVRRERSEVSRSGRFKRHLIKKLVPKKLRHGKKKDEDQRRADMHKGDELEHEPQEVKISRVDQVLCVKEEKLERWSSGHCLSAIVLAGLLLAGRGAALLITLLWCLILTYVRRLGC